MKAAQSTLTITVPTADVWLVKSLITRINGHVEEPTPAKLPKKETKTKAAKKATKALSKVEKGIIAGYKEAMAHQRGEIVLPTWEDLKQEWAAERTDKKAKPNKAS